MQNNAIKESIWADGCPQNVKDEMKLNLQDLLLLAVDYVVRYVCVPNGFKIEQAMGKLGVFPNIVMSKNNQLYAVIVVPFLYPNYGAIQDDVRIDIVNEAKKHNAKPLFAPVGFKSTDDARAEAGLALKGDTFHYLCRGFIELTDEENQNLFESLGQFKMF